MESYDSAATKLTIRYPQSPASSCFAASFFGSCARIYHSSQRAALPPLLSSPTSASATHLPVWLSPAPSPESTKLHSQSRVHPRADCTSTISFRSGLRSFELLPRRTG